MLRRERGFVNISGLINQRVEKKLMQEKLLIKYLKNILIMLLELLILLILVKKIQNNSRLVLKYLMKLLEVKRVLIKLKQNVLLNLLKVNVMLLIIGSNMNLIKIELLLKVKSIMINGQKYLVNKLKKMELLQKDLIELFMVLLNLKIQINGLILIELLQLIFFKRELEKLLLNIII